MRLSSSSAFEDISTDASSQTDRSKDKVIRLWDAVGGVCIHTMAAGVGEITSGEFDHEGKYLLAGCKDNSNRLWDLRMVGSRLFLIGRKAAAQCADLELL